MINLIIASDVPLFCKTRLHERVSWNRFAVANLN